MEEIAICTEAEESSSLLLHYAKVQAQKKSCASMLQEHPCFDTRPRFKFSKLKLVVASANNVGNNYWESKKAELKVATAKGGITQLRSTAKKDPRLRAIEVSGSGDALTSNATFEILRMIREEFPYFTTCVVTNGLLLPRKLALLQDLGIHAIKVAVNAVDADVGQQIYSYIRLNGKILRGREAFEVLSINQLEGLRNAADAGLMVSVDTAYIPGVNSEHLVEVAKIVRSLGAYVISIVPLAQSRGVAGLDTPSVEEMARIRRDCEDVVVSNVLLHAWPTASYGAS